MSIQYGQTRPSGLAIGSFSSHRKLIQWNVPNVGIVEMYINPQAFSISEKKLIKSVRTKGGYVIQYWGEELPEIDISGTTGSGGIEGINVLRDIYRQEQVGFNDVVSKLNNNFLSNLFETTLDAAQDLNPVAITNTLANITVDTTNALNPKNLFKSVSNTIDNVANVFTSIGGAVGSDQQLLPTLAALATGVELMYDGKIYRGFFREFRVDERAEESGLFKYSMKFTVTRQSGQRLNSFPWQRSVAYGPANSDTVPLTFGALNTLSPNRTVPVVVEPPVPNAGVSRRSLLIGK